MRRLPAHLWAMMLALGLAFLALAGTPARAELPARPDGPILDQANVIPPEQEVPLDQRLRAYTAATGRSVIVATVSSLDGLEDEQYAQELAEAWEIGGAETEEGVLLLVAPAERKVRIHTARGVQDRMTDALSGRIIRDEVVPRFKANDYGGGITAAVAAVIAQLDRSPADAKAIAEAAAAAGQGEEGDLVVAIIFVLIILALVYISWRSQRGAGRRSSDPGVFIWGPGLGGGSSGSSWGGGGGFGGFGGGGGGFDGGGASGDW